MRDREGTSSCPRSALRSEWVKFERRKRVKVHPKEKGPTGDEEGKEGGECSWTNRWNRMKNFAK